MSHTPPQVFISYAWTSSEHQQRVERLASELHKEGIKAILDKWELKPGHDTISFMERISTDPNIKKYLVIVDSKYTEKANARHGGVGKETYFLSKITLDSSIQNQVIPLLFQPNSPMAAYLQTRLYLDFSTDESWADNWDKLIDCIYDLEPERPEVGPIPARVLKRLEAQNQKPTQPAAPQGAAPQPSTTALTFHRRLLDVLEWHDLDVLSGSQVLADFDFTPAVLADPDQSFKHLNPRFMAFVTSHFQVSRDYLLGKTVDPGREPHPWYKSVHHLCSRITELHQAKLLCEVRVVTFRDDIRTSSGGEHDLFVLLTLQHEIEGTEYLTHEIWEATRWNHPPARIDMKTLILFCEELSKRHPAFTVLGGVISKKDFQAVLEKKKHITSVISEGWLGYTKNWYPDELIRRNTTDPDELQELQKAQEQFKKHGLEDLMDEFNPSTEQVMVGFGQEQGPLKAHVTLPRLNRPLLEAQVKVKHKHTLEGLVARLRLEQKKINPSIYKFRTMPLNTPHPQPDNYKLLFGEQTISFVAESLEWFGVEVKKEELEVYNATSNIGAHPFTWKVKVTFSGPEAEKASAIRDLINGVNVALTDLKIRSLMENYQRMEIHLENKRTASLHDVKVRVKLDVPGLDLLRDAPHVNKNHNLVSEGPVPLIEKHISVLRPGERNLIGELWCKRDPANDAHLPYSSQLPVMVFSSDLPKPLEVQLNLNFFDAQE